MIKASTSILSKNNINLLNKLGIDYYLLNNSKANELAFATNNHRNREFEIKFMSNGTYRISTRYLGYKNVIKLLGKEVVTANDPDGRRRSFYTIVYDLNELNSVIELMLTAGYSSNPRIELI